MNRWKDNVSFILVETIEPGNIGASARALKNLGFSRLELVRPLRFPSNEAEWFAHGAQDVISAVQIHSELASAVRQKSIIVGTTRRAGKKRGPLYSIRDAAKRLRHLSENNRIALLFGREDRGLTNEQAAVCSFMVRIPAAPENPSFNLAQAVLIVAYELFSSNSTVTHQPAIISNEEFSNLFQRITKMLRMAGYTPKGIRDSEEGILKDLKRLIARTAITQREARMLHGIISQIKESIGKGERGGGR